MTSDELLRVIEQAAREGSTELDLGEQNLTEIPPEISKLENLSKLDLSSNQISKLPPEIAQLQNLSELDLRFNQLSNLPSEIGQLQRLQNLSLSSNRLVTLPQSIQHLSNLSALHLASNKLKRLPRDFGRLPNLSLLNINSNQISSILPEITRLSQLTHLYISSNQLTDLPPEIEQLKNLSVLNLNSNQIGSLPPEIGSLKNLTILYLNSNKIAQLPAKIANLQNLTRLDINSNQVDSLFQIAQLRNLHTLNISANRISSLPKEISNLQNLSVLNLNSNHLSGLPKEIGELKSLSQLNLRTNQLVNLPSSIQKLQNLSILFLNSNRLTTLPPELKQLKNLSQLNLRANEALPIPPEIANRSSEAQTILDYYFRDRTKQSRPLNEAKVLLVGEAKVGKTSIVRRLIDDNFDPSEQMTDGISIRPWPITVYEKAVKLNLWDFGGQEIMHATHQFFLTKRSLYLLVLSARQDELSNRIEYWLKIIRSFGGNSPIIIVGNQVDQKSLDIDRRGLKKKYPNIVTFIETSCSQTNHKGIKKLEKEIKTQISKLPHVFDELPSSWFSVKTQLEKLDTDYIPYHQYQKICTDKNIVQEQNQKTLVGFLHDLGIALNFSDDPRLQQDSILNPDWVTNGVYSILNDNVLMTQHKGILERSMLNRILDPQRYPSSKHLFILDIMRKFELCFPVGGFENERYLLPDLLSKEEPETGTWDNALPFQYHYNILPGSIMSRFIVRMNPLISKRTYWRNGIVLTKGGNKALAKADKEDRRIFIWISGNRSTRRHLLESIRDQFDYIHSTIPGIEIEEKVPLPNNPSVLVDYKNLLDMESMGVSEFVPSGLKEKTRVRDLLEGIETFQSRESRIEARKELDRQFSSPPPVPESDSHPQTARRTPWGSGLFYLFVFFSVTALLIVVSHYVPVYMVPVIIIGALLAIGVIGAFQLMQDERFSEENFLVLIVEAYKRLPLLGSNQTNKEQDQSDK
ncbi:MAG: COR domain-containing protein [Cyanobacteria bacterium P01_A01_bin.116]